MINLPQIAISPCLISGILKTLILVIFFSVCIAFIEEGSFGGSPSTITEVLFSKVNLIWVWMVSAF